MRFTNITDEQIVNELVAIFSDEAKNRTYNTEGATYLGVLGWAGPMSPESRLAFALAFGPQRLASAEEKARRIIADNAEQYAATRHAGHVAEADANGDAVPAAGSFVWAVHSGWKNEGRGLLGELDTLIRYHEDDDRRRLVRIDKVVHVTDVTEAAMPDDLVAEAAANGEEFPGGARNDDEGFRDLRDEYRTWYTVGAAVVDGSGRWFAIDSEGYDYARYILVPASWRSMYRAEAEAIDDKIAAEQQAARDAEAARQAEELEDYRRRCEKWAPYMTDVRPLEQAARDARKQHGWNSAEVRTAERKLTAAKRANITAMVRAAFPGLKFSLKKTNGWGSDYSLTWTDGPTAEEFEAATDLRLFRCGYDTFDGMTDCAGYEREEHTEFAQTYMGENGEDVEAERTYSAGKLAELAAAICETTGKDEAADGYTVAECKAIADAYGADWNALCRAADLHGNARDMAFVAWKATSFYKSPEKSAETAQGTAAAEGQDEAPAEGLELIETEGGVAVVGDSRATYLHRKEIKAHGAAWNKTAKRWEATGTAAETVRAWFGR